MVCCKVGYAISGGAKRYTRLLLSSITTLNKCRLEGGNTCGLVETGSERPNHCTTQIA
jgi:hypothetical protein